MTEKEIKSARKTVNKILDMMLKNGEHSLKDYFDRTVTIEEIVRCEDVLDILQHVSQDIWDDMD